jgi:hypothetical protein
MNVLTQFPKLDQVAHNRAQRRLAWEVYKSTHPLIRYRQYPAVIDFVNSSIDPRSIVSVDSGPLGMLQYKTADKVFNFDDIDYSVQYFTVLACNTAPFKYKTIDECADVLLQLARLLTPGGTMISILPITVMLFHRLNYKYDQVIEIINHKLVQFGYVVAKRSFEIDLYLITVKKI